MKPTRFLFCCVALLATLAGAAERPNFIVINIDDRGYADIGPFGSKLNRTPHLDRMASEGRKLTCFYAASSCRLQRTMMTLGQAAGNAAAVAVKHHVDPRRIDVVELQAALQSQGVDITAKEL